MFSLKQLMRNNFVKMLTSMQDNKCVKIDSKITQIHDI